MCFSVLGHGRPWGGVDWRFPSDGYRNSHRPILAFRRGVTSLTTSKNELPTTDHTKKMWMGNFPSTNYLCKYSFRAHPVEMYVIVTCLLQRRPIGWVAHTSAVWHFSFDFIVKRLDTSRTTHPPIRNENTIHLTGVTPWIGKNTDATHNQTRMTQLFNPNETIPTFTPQEIYAPLILLKQLYPYSRSLTLLQYTFLAFVLKSCLIEIQE